MRAGLRRSAPPAGRARGAAAVSATVPYRALRRRARAAEPSTPHDVGPIGRLGRYTATHFRTVLVGWLVVAVGLGFFAPRVETALSGRRLGSERVAVGAGAQAHRTRLRRPRQLRADDGRLLPDRRRSAPRRSGRRSRASSRRCGRTARCARSSRPRPGCRSPPTVTPRSCRPAPRATPTRWSPPPTA